MIKKLLIANRGEIAVRIIRACHQLGIKTVAIYSDVDKHSLHVKLANESICVGGYRPIDSYLNQQNILSAALVLGCDAIHPGFGFLSENAKFAQIVEDLGLIFVGPSARLIELMGNKVMARQKMIEAGVPVVLGSEGTIVDASIGLQLANEIGYPVMIKARSGGGGRGMRMCFSQDDFIHLFDTAKQESLSAFGDDGMYVEKLILNPHHVEVQVIGDHHGHYLHLGERDCSMQRRNQKMIEEAPSPFISDELRQKMFDASIKAIKEIGYNSVGTIEYLVDDDQNFYFMEMNTRIQVEHPVTEMITGIDIVKEQIKIAGGHAMSFKQEDVRFTGHAMECRINAENPAKNFMPSPGIIGSIHLPGGFGVRVDTGVYHHYEILPFYDSMVAKLIVHGSTRLECIKKMRTALAEMIIEGVDNNIEFHYLIMHHPRFVEGVFNTSFLEKFVEEVDFDARFI